MKKNKNKHFSLNWSLGAFILLIAHVGQGCDSRLLTVLEDAVRGCTGLEAILGGLYPVALELQDKDIHRSCAASLYCTCSLFV